ncbi:protein pxr-1 [Solanum tuberosum]|uniref:Nucleolar protein 58 n=1 Tax=Solanum tuberosum TaxID=4113 RepID=M1CDM3_SOLTU|nr:PREDICTED: protein pxr-1-like [Solanum tuberosum]
MKRVSAKVESTIPISLSAAAKSLSKFAASDHEASHAVSLYLQGAADSFNKLVKIQQKLSVKKEHDVKVEEISEKKNRDVGLKVEKNEDIPNGFRENKKSKNLVKEENPEAEPKTKNSSKIDKVKGHKLIKTEQKLDIGEEEMEKSNKNELEFVKIDRELELKEVKEDGMTSRDKKKKKKKKKKKDRGVGDSEHEVGKVEEDGKSMDPDAGSASAEQSSKKKSKKRRIEGDE